MIIGSCTSLQLGAAIATPLLGELGPGLTTALRLLLAAIVLLAVARPRFWRWPRGGLRAVALFGLVMAGMNGCFYAALDRIPLGTAVTIEFIGPLALAAVLSRRLRDLAWVVLAAAAIAVLGLEGESTGSGPLDPIGVAFALAAGGFWALYILAGKRVGATVAGQGPLAVALLVGSVVIAPFGAGAVGDLVAQPALLLPIAGVALLSSLIPYSLEFAALRRLSSRAFGILLSLEPVIAALAGWALLGQSMSWIAVAAMTVVIVASIASTLMPQSQPLPPSTGAVPSSDQRDGPGDDERQEHETGERLERHQKLRPVRERHRVGRAERHRIRQ